MEKDNIRFEGDTVNTNKKANISLIIRDRKIQEGDSSYTVPYRVHKISEVNIIPDYQEALINKKPDTLIYGDFNILLFESANTENLPLQMLFSLIQELYIEISIEIEPIEVLQNYKVFNTLP